jgi:hypothetical protein
MSLKGLRLVGAVAMIRRRKVRFYFYESLNFLEDLYSLWSDRHTKNYVGTVVSHRE